MPEKSRRQRVWLSEASPAVEPKGPEPVWEPQPEPLPAEPEVDPEPEPEPAKDEPKPKDEPQQERREPLFIRSFTLPGLDVEDHREPELFGVAVDSFTITNDYRDVMKVDVRATKDALDELDHRARGG